MKNKESSILDFNIARIQKLQNMKNGLVDISGTDNSNFENLSLAREFNYLEKSNAFKEAKSIAT